MAMAEMRGIGIMLRSNGVRQSVPLTLRSVAGSKIWPLYTGSPVQGLVPRDVLVSRAEKSPVRIAAVGTVDVTGPPVFWRNCSKRRRRRSSGARRTGAG